MSGCIWMGMGLCCLYFFFFGSLVFFRELFFMSGVIMAMRNEDGGDGREVRFSQIDGSGRRG